MRIGPRFDVTCNPLKIQAYDIKWVDSVNYLGITITRAKMFKCHWNECRGRFYSSVNTILGRLGCNASIDVLLKLVHSQAVPSLLYGISAATLKGTELNKFCYAYNNIYFKKFRSFDKNTILYCQWFCGFWPFELFYDYHRYNFLNKLVITECLDSKLDLDCSDYLDYANLKLKYGIMANDSIAKIRYNFWKYFETLLE